MTAKKKKDGGQRNPIMPRPSYMWIYVLVAAFIIGYSLYGAENTEPVRSDWNTVEGMVRSGDVERIEVVNRDVAEVFLKKDAVEKYRTDSTQPQFKRLPDEGVQLVFNIGSVDAFREDLKAAEQQSGQSVPVRYENKENGWMNLLVNFLPWVLIIGVWFFIMRGMSRGGGAAGGGLMNVGKAKAQVYDKDAPKRVTFKDVAGGAVLYLLLYIGLLLPTLFVCELFRRSATPLANLGATLLGVLYVAVPLSLLLYVPVLAGDGVWRPETVLCYIFIIWANDVFAYLVGMTFGRHRLCERLSPKKSWEGFFGGLAGAVATGLAAAYALDPNYWVWGGLALVASLSGVAGDLVESMFKREAGVKDSGQVIPGHGGVLDRFDALLLSAPYVFLYLLLVGRFV